MPGLELLLTVTQIYIATNLTNDSGHVYTYPITVPLLIPSYYHRRFQEWETYYAYVYYLKYLKYILFNLSSVIYKE